MTSSVRHVALRAGHIATRILLPHDGCEVRCLVGSPTTTDKDDRSESNQADEHGARTNCREHTRHREQRGVVSHARIISHRGHLMVVTSGSVEIGAALIAASGEPHVFWPEVL